MCVCVCVCVCVCKRESVRARQGAEWGLHSVVSHSLGLYVAHEAPLSTGLLRQEYWTGLSLPSPGHLPHPGIESESLASPPLEGRFFTTSCYLGSWVY